MTSATENEVKIRVSDRAAALDRIQGVGFAVSVARAFESNTLYDTPNASLRQQRMLLRLREIGGLAIITWKGPGEPGPHKSRPELETTVGSKEVLDRILHHLGFTPTLRYEKYRTEFTRGNGPGVITVDETPIGDFLELEGPGEWIDSTAQQLGFSSNQYILDSYARLYVVDCERRGIQPTHMIFASHPSGNSR